MIEVHVTHNSRISTVFIMPNGRKVYTRGIREYFIVVDTIKAMDLSLTFVYNGTTSTEGSITYNLMNH